MLFGFSELAPEERAVIARIEELRATLRNATRDVQRWTGLLRRSTLARAIRGSNTIEGYDVSRDDAVAAVEGEEPLQASQENWRAVVGYRLAMTYIMRLADDPNFQYSGGLLGSLHYMMLQHEPRKKPGVWRAGPVYVRDEESGTIVHEGPDAEAVPALMDELVAALNESDGEPVIVHAALAHLNLTMIHPFSDGNGRMARALQTLVLVREGILVPEFCSIEEYLGRNSAAYYEVLAEVGQGRWHPENNARPWIRFCLTAHYRQARTLQRRSKEYGRAWDELEIEMSRRELPERAILALHDATFGYGVRNSTYRSAADISLNLASRDLKLLSDQGLLKPIGVGRGRVYVATEILTAIRERIREPRTDDDPFALAQDDLPGLDAP